jgi:hypothetical protein
MLLSMLLYAVVPSFYIVRYFGMFPDDADANNMDMRGEKNTSADWALLPSLV